MATVLRTLWTETYELWDAVLGVVGGVFTKVSWSRMRREEREVAGAKKRQASSVGKLVRAKDKREMFPRKESWKTETRV